MHQSINQSINLSIIYIYMILRNTSTNQYINNNIYQSNNQSTYLSIYPSIYPPETLANLVIDRASLLLAEMGQWSEIDQRGPVGPVEKSATCRAFRMKTFGLMGIQLIFVLALSAAWTRWAILIHIEHVFPQRVLGKWEKILENYEASSLGVAHFQRDPV